MSDGPKRVIVRQTIEQQIAEQGITIADGETPIRYRDLLMMQSALTMLANKKLPTKEARIHVARCVRALKPSIDDYKEERSRIQKDHEPNLPSAEEGDRVQFTDPLGMSREFAELDRMVASIKLPSVIKDAMLPVEDLKTNPDAATALSAIMADLGPLYPIDAE